MTDQAGDALQTASSDDSFLGDQKGQDWDLMRDITMFRGCGGQQQVPLWQDVDLGIDGSHTAGKTGQNCCCDHQECAFFRQKNWCSRLFLLRLVNEDQDGQSLDVSGLRTLVRATLSTRSYRKMFFRVDYDMTGRKLESILVVYLAAGEPPLTADELTSWNDCAATMGVEGGTCHVDMLRCSCCFPRASLAMSRLLHLCWNLDDCSYESDGSDDDDDDSFSCGGLYYGDLLQELGADVGATATPEWECWRLSEESDECEEHRECNK